MSANGRVDTPKGRTLTRREFLNVTARWSIGTAATGIGGIAYMRGIEPNLVELKSVPLALPRLSPQFSGYKIVQISDIHMGDWMTRPHLEDLVSLANNQQPDLIVLTGDVASDTLSSELVAALKGLRAKDAIVGVLGNHDHWSNAGAAREAMQASGITDLSNDLYTLERTNALLHIAGVDDIWERKQRLDLVLDKLPGEGAAILLAHEPDFADTSAATGRFDLQISGHSHGGQVIIPFLGAPRLPYLGVKYYLGLYEVGNMLQYTNRGVGMIYPYVRFNCRPEITVFTLDVPGAV